MIRAYDEVYLQPAQDNMAFMLDYAVNDAGFTIEDFFRLFIGSRFARRFEAGDYMYITGMSGIELAGRILEAAGMAYRIREPRIRFHRTEEHWAGWILAYYQWWSALTFREIEEAIGITGIRDMYHPYHEMDIMQAIERIDSICRKETRLKNMRICQGLSQSQLARASGVPVRTIQQYEQRERDINRAQAASVAALAAALGTESAYLLENHADR